MYSLWRKTWRFGIVLSLRYGIERERKMIYFMPFYNDAQPITSRSFFHTVSHKTRTIIIAFSAEIYRQKKPSFSLLHVLVCVVLNSLSTITLKSIFLLSIKFICIIHLRDFIALESFSLFSFSKKKIPCLSLICKKYNVWSVLILVQ